MYGKHVLVWFKVYFLPSRNSLFWGSRELESHKGSDWYNQEDRSGVNHSDKLSWALKNTKKRVWTEVGSAFGISGGLLTMSMFPDRIMLYIYLIQKARANLSLNWTVFSCFVKFARTGSLCLKEPQLLKLKF